jgi:hypothetical protein
MNPITVEQARVQIVKLSLPELVTDLFDGKLAPPPIEWLYRDPYEIFEEPCSPELYPSGDITPLFSDHTGYTITAYRHGGGVGGFLRFGLEDGCVDDEGLSWQGILVGMVVMFHELSDGADNGASAREAARLLGFRHVNRLLLEYGGQSPQSHQAWLHAFSRDPLL